ncbi:Mss4-like protein [Aspergillus falconensis]
MPTVTGSCYCGKTCYQTTGPLYGLSYCYCHTCQLLHGAPFAPFTNVKREHFQWTRSDDLVELRLSTFATRTVCGTCHAPVSMVYDGKPDEVGLVAVTVNEQNAVPEVEGHIFVGSKPKWYTIGDNAPQEMGVPEEMKGYVIA